jgi:hypothetical protein
MLLLTLGSVEAVSYAQMSCTVCRMRNGIYTYFFRTFLARSNITAVCSSVVPSIETLEIVENAVLYYSTSTYLELVYWQGEHVILGVQLFSSKLALGTVQMSQ